MARPAVALPLLLLLTVLVCFVPSSLGSEVAASPYTTCSDCTAAGQGWCAFWGDKQGNGTCINPTYELLCLVSYGGTLTASPTQCAGPGDTCVQLSSDSSSRDSVSSNLRSTAACSTCRRSKETLNCGFLADGLGGGQCLQGTPDGPNGITNFASNAWGVETFVTSMCSSPVEICQSFNNEGCGKCASEYIAGAVCSYCNTTGYCNVVKSHDDPSPTPPAPDCPASAYQHDLRTCPTLSDPCSFYDRDCTGCSETNSELNCGWCAGSSSNNSTRNRCMSGSHAGPLRSSCPTASWSYFADRSSSGAICESPSPDSGACSSYGSCVSCVAATSNQTSQYSSCRWCSTGDSFYSGFCGDAQHINTATCPGLVDSTMQMCFDDQFDNAGQAGFVLAALLMMIAVCGITLMRLVFLIFTKRCRPVQGSTLMNGVQTQLFVNGQQQVVASAAGVQQPQQYDCQNRVLPLLFILVAFTLQLTAMGVDTWTVVTTNTASSSGSTSYYSQNTLNYGVLSVLKHNPDTGDVREKYSTLCNDIDRAQSNPGTSNTYNYNGDNTLFAQCQALQSSGVLTLVSGIVSLVAHSILILIGLSFVLGCASRLEKWISRLWTASVIAYTTTTCCFLVWSAAHLLLANAMIAGSQTNRSTKMGPSWALNLVALILSFLISVYYKHTMRRTPSPAGSLDAGINAHIVAVAYQPLTDNHYAPSNLQQQQQQQQQPGLIPARQLYAHNPNAMPVVYAQQQPQQQQAHQQYQPQQQQHPYATQPQQPQQQPGYNPHAYAAPNQQYAPPTYRQPDAAPQGYHMPAPYAPHAGPTH